LDLPANPEETAEIATHAALTEHLVLSTLHTNDAIGALTRLIDLGIAPYLVASTVEAVLAQRLVRSTCGECAVSAPIDRADALALGFPEGEELDVCRGVGCEACRGTGYRGRTGIHELLVINEEIRAEIGRRRGAGELRRIALATGMRRLRGDGLRQIRAGMTTPEEVLRVTLG
jgi:type II secretory ATPase GspE/PulE/Tfp pilus assembly ATPase PilB-like protein